MSYSNLEDELKTISKNGIGQVTCKKQWRGRGHWGSALRSQTKCCWVSELYVVLVQSIRLIMPSFTPDSELDLLFSANFISPEVKSQLHSDLHVGFQGVLFTHSLQPYRFDRWHPQTTIEATCLFSRSSQWSLIQVKRHGSHSSMQCALSCIHTTH